jgi:hypothetical protein
MAVYPKISGFSGDQGTSGSKAIIFSREGGIGAAPMVNWVCERLSLVKSPVDFDRLAGRPRPSRVNSLQGNPIRFIIEAWP